MYQQSSSGKWIFYLALLLVGLALMVGLLISASDWLHPDIAQAQARQMNVEIDRQVSVNENADRLEDIQTDLTIQDLIQQQVNRVAEDIQKTAARERRDLLVDDLISLLFYALAIAVVTVGCAAAIKIALPVQSAAPAAQAVSRRSLASARSPVSAVAKSRPAADRSPLRSPRPVQAARSKPAVAHNPAAQAAQAASRAEQAALDWRLENATRCLDDDREPAAPSISRAEQAALERRLNYVLGLPKVEIGGDAHNSDRKNSSLADASKSRR